MTLHILMMLEKIRLGLPYNKVHTEWAGMLLGSRADLEIW